jgi:hypothetical protein
MKFRDFLTENKNSTIVAAFGRFNVPTIGHGLLAKKVVDTAKSVKADHIVYASRTQDAKKNPLDVDTKVKYLKKMFPGINFKAANEDVRTFIEMAAKLSEEGYKNLVMIAGSDRIEEYQKLLDKYNGKDFKFNSIKVVSAGERDPDADGAAGMSGTKMREAAIKGDFKAFRSGIPKTLSDKETKELMDKVRKIMIKEEFNINEAFAEILTEGVHDKAIFKAVFLAGGPGSGKDYVLDNTLAGHGLTEINSDKALEFLMDKEGLDKTMPASENEKKDIVRGRAKNITELRQKLALLGRNGLIINGTGDDVEKITKIKKRLEEIGYDSSMIVVNTADEISKQRNIERGQRGGRTVPENIRKEKWDNVQAGRAEFAKMFGQNYMEFDNSEDLRQAPPEVVKAKKEEMLQLFTNIKNFVAAKPASDAAKQWIASELDKKDTLKVPKGGAEKVAHPDSGAAEEARKLGLQYYGFGRYGQNGVVTHRSVHDSLVEIPKDKPKETTVPISGSSMRKPEPKKVNEDFESFLNESVTVSITGDTADEVKQALKLLTNSDEEQDEVDEEYQLSDRSAFNVLTLGTQLVKEEVSKNKETKKTKLLRHDNGKVKTYMLRRAAAKEAHTINGSVMKNPNGGYVVKIKEENEDVNEINQLIETQTGRETSGSGNASRTNTSARTSSSSRETTSEETSGQENTRKITLAEIRKRKEAQVKESIDMGIEPGISMAASGENLRSTVRKKRIEELTGDETTLSNSAQVEDELKRKGINLKSFKASRYGSF